MASNGPISLTNYFLDLLAYAMNKNATIENVQKVIENTNTETLCKAGNVLCEWTGGQYNLPDAISDLVAKGQDYLSFLPREYTGPVSLAGVVTIGGIYIYKTYGAKDAMTLIKNIIRKEFGDKAVIIFNLFEKAIQEAIDKMIEDFKTNYAETAKTMSINQKNAQKNEFTNKVLESLLGNLAQNLKENKEGLLEHAQVLKDAQTPVNAEAVVTMPGQQKAQSAQLSQEKAQKKVNKFILDKFLGLPKLPKKKVTL